MKYIELYGFDESTKRCLCGNPLCPERSRGKHPKKANWLSQGSESFPEGPYGILTGKASGIAVLDLDGEAGFHSYRRLLEALGPLPETFTVRTGKGVHYYFEYADQPSIIGWHQGVDILSDNRFVVGPGTRHINGTVYSVIKESPVATMPDNWIKAIANAKPPEKGAKVYYQPLAQGSRECDEMALRGIEFLEREDPSIQGQNGSLQTFRVCRDLLHRYRLPEVEAKALFTRVYNPRCAPPWGSEEIDRKFQQARDNVFVEVIPYATEKEKEQLVEIANIGAPAIGKPKVHRLLPRHDHSYSYTIGRVGIGDKRTPSLDEVANTLSTIDAWAGVWQRNELSGVIHAVNPPMPMQAEVSGLTDVDVTNTRLWFLTEMAMAISTQAMREAIETVANQNRYHPVQEWLHGLPEWDGVDRFAGSSERLAGRPLGIVDDMLRCFFVAAARRALRPGTKADTLLVLSGDQGAFKSSWVQLVFGKEWSRDQMPDLHNRNAASYAIQGAWVIEIAELDAILKVGEATVKDFLSRTEDTFRKPYEKYATVAPRQCVFVGTTNDQHLLRDATGARRYWVVPIEEGFRIDLAWWSKNRIDLWSQAYALAHRATFAHYLDSPQSQGLIEVQADMQLEDVWHETIQDFCEGKERVTVQAIFDHLQGGSSDLTKLGRREQLRVYDTLRRMGYTPHKTEHKRFWAKRTSLVTAEGKLSAGRNSVSTLAKRF